MAISLKKGGRFNLSKNEPSLEKVMVGLGWEMKSDTKLDLDVSVFMVGASGKVPADEYFVFYNNLKSPDGSVQHTGDNRTGEGDGDDEMVLANLPLVSSSVNELIFITSIHEAVARRHNFGMLKDAYIRVVDVSSNREILRYDLDSEFFTHTDVEFGRLVRENGEWSFVASGLGENGGLQVFLDKYA